MKKIIIAAGGTGGHIYPAISLTDKLKKNFQVIFIVKKNDKAINILKKLKLNYYEILITGFPRKISFVLIEFILNLLLSFIKTYRILVVEKPVCCIGFGSYISFPVILVSKLLKIKTVIHEQNIIPGLANHILGKITDKVALSFEYTRKYFNYKKTLITGNFVREEILNITKQHGLNWFNSNFNLNFKNEKFTILILGGSQGAHFINNIIIHALDLLEEYKDKIQIIHLTGEKDFVYVREKYKIKNYKNIVLGYLEEIGYAYSISDIVICRSGATTIAELIALKKPCILIPYPYATGNHQLYNALYLSKNGSGIVIEEKVLNPLKLVNILTKFINNPELLKKYITSYNNFKHFSLSSIQF